MKLARTSVFQSFVALILATIGVSTYGCSDSGSVNPEVELASLTVASASGPATLQPAFSSTTTQYSVDVSNNMTNVTVTAQPAVSGDTVSIDGQTTTVRDINLGQPVPSGSTTLVNIVVSESTSKSRTYTVLIRRAGLAGNNSLQNLTVSSGTLVPTFKPDTLEYTITVAPEVGSVTITATKDDPNAVLSGDVPNEGLATITLNGPGTSKPVLINVTAPNGNAKTYRITVNRAAPLDNNNLSALNVSTGVFDQPFSPSTLNYTVSLAGSVDSVTITATKSDPNARISGDITAEAGAAEGHVTLSVGPGGNKSVSINVSAPNGASKTYTISIFRAPR